MSNSLNRTSTYLFLLLCVNLFTPVITYIISFLVLSAKFPDTDLISTKLIAFGFAIVSMTLCMLFAKRFFVRLLSIKFNYQSLNN